MGSLVILRIMRELFNEITQGTSAILFVVMVISVGGLIVSMLAESWLTHSLTGITMFAFWFLVITGLFIYDTRK